MASLHQVVSWAISHHNLAHPLHIKEIYISVSEGLVEELFIPQLSKLKMNPTSENYACRCMSLKIPNLAQSYVKVFIFLSKICTLLENMFFKYNIYA